MGLLKRKSAQDIVAETKDLYEKGQISKANKLLHSIKTTELLKNGEALYLISKIYLETIDELTDQKDIDNRYNVIESFLFKAIRLSHRGAKELYEQYFDSRGKLKTNATVDSKAENKQPVEVKVESKQVVEAKVESKQPVEVKVERKQVVDAKVENKQPVEVKVESKQVVEAKIENKQPVEVKVESKQVVEAKVESKQSGVSIENPKLNVKYPHEENYNVIPTKVFETIQDHLQDSMKDSLHFLRGRWLDPKLGAEMKRVFPELQIDKIVLYYSSNQTRFKKKWIVFTLTDYYDSDKTHVSIKDIVKHETYENRRYESISRFYYRTGKKAEAKLLLYTQTFDKYRQAVANLGSTLRDVGYNAQKNNNYEKAYEHYLASAMMYNNDLAQNDLGILYQNGLYVNKDSDRAIYWYKLSANQNNVYALSNLGALYQRLKQYDLAFSCLTKGAQHKDATSNIYNNLGLCYLNGQGVGFNLDHAIKYFRLASDKGNMYADYNLGRVYTSYIADYKLGFDYYNRAAQKNHSHANVSLGVSYFYGRGVDIDYKKALEYFNKAMQINDNSLSYANIGTYYAKVEKNMDLAMEYYNKALERGWLGYGTIASMYMDNHDYPEGLKWLYKGVEMNQDMSKFKLALMHIEGLRVQKDYDKAFEIVSRANSEGNMNISALLGQLYLEGKGVQQDTVYGQQLLENAIERKNTYARYYMGRCLIEGEYLNKDINLGLKYLFDLNKIKGDEYADQVSSKLLDYILDGKYNLMNECDTNNLLHLFNIIDYTSYPNKQIEIAQYLFKDRKQGNAKIFSSLAKSYHFGINHKIDYDKAVEYYEKCLYCRDYRYDSEVEFNYASLRFEGKGSIQDFVYGFNMAKAIGAYDGKCPNRQTPYVDGKDRFIKLVVQYLDQCKKFEFICFAASLVDLNKPEYATLKEVTEAKYGHSLYEKAMRVVDELKDKMERDQRELNKFDERGMHYTKQYEIKKDLFEEQNDAIHTEIINTLIDAADNGCFEAIKYLVYTYDEEPWHLDYLTCNNYAFRLMKFYNDEGILDQAKYMRIAYEHYVTSKFDFAITKIRELIVARDRGNIIPDALSLAYASLGNYVDSVVMDDEVYMNTLREYYDDQYSKAYPRAKKSLGLIENDGSVKSWADLKYVYIDFDIADVEDFAYDFLENINEYFYEVNERDTVNIYMKDKRIIDLCDLHENRSKDIKFNFKKGDNVKLEFIGIEDIENHVLYFVEQFIETDDYVKSKNIYSMKKVMFAYEDNHKYYFMENETSKLVEVARENTIYMAPYFKQNYETYIIFKGDEPVVVFNIETKQRLL